MRIAAIFGVAITTALATSDGSDRYLVVPAGHDDITVYTCRAALSADGGIVAFEAVTALDPSDRNGTTDVYLLERASGRITLVSKSLTGGAARGGSRCPSLSDDGQRLVFESDAADLVAGDWAGSSDIFFLDRRVGRVERVSRGAYARETMRSHPSISADGHVVVYHARDPDPSPPDPLRVYRASLDEAGVVELLGDGYRPVVSADGRVVAYLTIAHAGARPRIRVLDHGVLRVVGQGLGQGRPSDGAAAEAPALSADGQWVTYVSGAAANVGGRRLSGRAQVYLEHVESGRRYLVSATARGDEANGDSTRPALDGTGTRIVFGSTATNLGCEARGVAGCATDINLVSDIFLWDRGTGRVTRVNAASPDLPWLEASACPAISDDGRVVAFLSRQPVSPADGRDTFDLFLTTWTLTAASAGFTHGHPLPRRRQ